MQDMVMSTIKDDIKENRASLTMNSETCERLNTELGKFRSTIESKIAKMTPNNEFRQFAEDSQKKFERLSYSCSDLDNKIKTTDRYIDQFLPFHMIKEVSSFMEFLLPEEQAIQIKILKKEKIKMLYNRMFELDEVV